MVGSNRLVPVSLDRFWRMLSILTMKTTPITRPSRVPATPIDAPAMKNTRIMAPRVAPMVRRMAMSDDLSFTSMINPETMFSVATRMISDRIRNMVLLSTCSAESIVPFSSCQVTSRIIGPAALLIAGNSFRSASGSATIASMPLTVSPVSK